MVYKLIRVMDIAYREHKKTGEALVHVAGRDANHKRHRVTIEGTEPYAFLPEDTVLPDVPYITRVEDGYTGYDGTPLKRVIVRSPKNINRRKGAQLTDHFEMGEMYEADIPFERRVGIDYGLSGYIRVPKGRTVHIDDVDANIDPDSVEEIPPRVVMADIEVVPPRLTDTYTFQDFVDDGDQPVTAITFYDTYPGEYVAIVLDPEGKVDGGQIRSHLETHWEGVDGAETYTGASMRLVTAETEQSLLESFIAEMEHRRPDLISGWNWIDFDHQYLLNRLRHDDMADVNEHRLSDIGSVNGFRTAQLIDGLPGFDMMSAFCDKMSFSEWKSRRLDYVAEEELGLGKVENVNIATEYDEDRSRFVAYNIIDTQLLVALDTKHGVHDFFYLVASLSSIQIYDTFSEMRIVDGFVMSRRSRFEILPSMEEHELERIAGGLVLAPSRGVHEWTAVFDVKSLYPSMFLSLNVSAETLTTDPEEADLICPDMPESEQDVGGKITADMVGWDVADGALGIKTDAEGLLAKYLKLLFDLRDTMKATRNTFDYDDPEYHVWDSKQAAIKVIMNSFYGISQNAYYRLSNPVRGSQGVGSTITAAGRYTLWKGAQIAEEMGYTVKYGDTDSVFISLLTEGEDGSEVSPHEMVRRGKEIEAALNERMDEVADAFGVDETHPFLAGAGLHGNDRHAIQWEFEKCYRRFFQAGKKKRYAGLPAWKEGQWHIDPETGEGNPDPDITGFESKRSDAPEVTEKIQKEIMVRVLGGETFDDISDYLGEQVSTIRAATLPVWKIAKPGTLKKPIEQYGNTQNARACRYSNEHLGYEWREGDDPWIYFIRRTPPNLPNTDVIALEWGEEIPEGFELDTEVVIEKKVRAPIDSILAETGWSFEELATGRRAQGLDVADSGPSNPFASLSRESTPDPEPETDTESDDGAAGASDALSW